MLHSEKGVMAGVPHLHLRVCLHPDVWKREDHRCTDEAVNGGHQYGA